MGAAPSKGAEPRVVLDFILREMFSRADLTDIYSLADPNKCSKYIVVASDSLEKMFVKFNLYPNKGKDGTLYFQSVDGLTKGTSGAAKEIRGLQRKYCNELAFFFIRIFQTFAALTLSVFDTELPIVDPVEETPVTGPQRRATFIEPGAFLGIAQKPGASRGWFGQGGALTFDSRRRGNFAIRDPSQTGFVPTKYSILNIYLKPPAYSYSDTKGRLRFSGFDTMAITQNSLYTITPSGEGEPTRTPIPEDQMAPKIIYDFERVSPNTITAILNIKESGETIQITLKDFVLQSEVGSGKPVSPKTAQLSTIRDPPIYRGEEYPSARGKELPYLLQAMFESAIIDKLGEPPFSVVKFLRKMRYVGDSTTNPLQIAGTNIWIRPGQENASKITIVYRRSVVLPGDSKKTDVSIQAELEIEKPTLSTDNSYVYRLYLDFSNKKVQPSELAEYLTFPSVTQPKKFVAYSLDGEPKYEKTNNSIRQFLDEKFAAILENKDEDLPDKSGIKYTREGLPVPHNSDDIQEDMRVKRLWKALAAKPPIKSHCVARAVQLLSVQAIRGEVGEATFSSACNLKFAYAQTGALPKPGESITSEHGIYALATLFVEGLSNGSPKIVDSVKYKEFLRNLNYLFGKFGSKEETPMPDEDRISKITEKIIPTCEKFKDGRIEIPRALGQRLKVVARDLINQQMAHVGAVMNLIFKLFDRDAVINKRVLALNPAILRGGTPAVNAVAAEARDLLLKYYSGCETKYREGLTQIYEADRAAPLKAIGARTEAPAPAQKLQGAPK